MLQKTIKQYKRISRAEGRSCSNRVAMEGSLITFSAETGRKMKRRERYVGEEHCRKYKRPSSASVKSEEDCGLGEP